MTEDSSNHLTQGYYVSLWLNGVQIDSCFSTCAFTIENGVTYQVAVSDYGSECFSYWLDTGSTDRFFTFDNNDSTSTSVILHAVYSSCNSGTSQVTVTSEDTNGSAINGYYTVLFDSGGNTISTGFTQVSFTTTSGNSYSVQVDDYGSCSFAHWSDGVTSNPRTFVASSSPISFAAVYNCVANSNGITVTANRIPASYWAPCFATVCSRGTGPGASMFFTLYDSSGNVVATGFADENGYTFTGLNPSATYYVYPADCDSCHGSTHDVLFQYWATVSGTAINSTRPLQVKVGETVNAWYSCTNGCGGT